MWPVTDPAVVLPPHGEPHRALTRRQEQVVELLAFGLSYTEIGLRLGISRKTVRDRVNEVHIMLENPGGLEPEHNVRAWAGWRFWRKHFDRHPRVAQPGPPLTAGMRAD